MKIGGKKVIDAKRPLILSVTKRDVATGDKQKHRTCAAAIACQRQLHATGALVGLSKTYVEFSDHWVRYNTPMALRTEVTSFDRGADFSPDDYVLRAPSAYDRLGARKTQARRGPHHKKRRPYHKLKGVRAALTRDFFEAESAG